MKEFREMDKALCRILKDERYSDYSYNVEERYEDGRFFIRAENEDGKVLKLRFNIAQDGDGAYLLMYDDFYGDYLTSVKVA